MVYSKCFFSFLLLAVNLKVSAQYNDYPYKLSEQIDEKVSRDTVPWKYQVAAVEYSFIGAYSKMLSAADSQFYFVKKAARLSAEEAATVKSFRPVPAKKYLLRRAAREKIIIINEAHYQPQHRVFVTTLLEGLYRQGYRFLGIEALDYADTLLHQRKYPVLATGYYSREPQFGNLIREALQLGFTLFPYESREPLHNNAAREEDQAANIAAFIQQHPEGKFLVYCGYDHVTEGPHRSWGKAMAGRLKEKTGIDPLTINQDVLTEHSDTLYEKADYRAIHFSETAVLVNKQGNPYNGYNNDSLYDIRLYHPRTKYSFGRPDWLLQGPQLFPYFIPAENIQLAYPVLAMAFIMNENVETAIPTDVIELSDAEDKKALIVKKGSYNLLLKDRQGITQKMAITIQ